MYGIYMGGLKLTPASCLVFFVVSFIPIAYLWTRIGVFYSTSVFTPLYKFPYQLSCIFTRSLGARLKDDIVTDQSDCYTYETPAKIFEFTYYASLTIVISLGYLSYPYFF